MSRRYRLSTVVCVAFVLSSQPMLAQNPESRPQRSTLKWAVADAIGYGGLGTALGFLAAVATAGTESGCGFGPCAGALMAIPAGAIAGAMGGAVIGARAGRALSRGDQLGAGQRTAVVVGTLLAGTSIGAIASFSMINGDGSGTPIGSDEKTFGLLTIGGFALSTAFVATHSHELNGGRIRLSPTIGAGRYGASARLSF
jgi:hypothetical protein